MAVAVQCGGTLLAGMGKVLFADVAGEPIYDLSSSVEKAVICGQTQSIKTGLRLVHCSCNDTAVHYAGTRLQDVVGQEVPEAIHIPAWFLEPEAEHTPTDSAHTSAWFLDSLVVHRSIEVPLVEVL